MPAYTLYTFHFRSFQTMVHISKTDRSKNLEKLRRQNFDAESTRVFFAGNISIFFSMPSVYLSHGHITFCNKH